jgi:hypothetical protein
MAMRDHQDNEVERKSIRDMYFWPLRLSKTIVGTIRTSLREERRELQVEVR